MLKTLLEGSALEIQRARAHLFGLLPPDGSGAWEVDLSVPRFVEKVAGRTHVDCPVQVIASWSPTDQVWLWADANPSFSKVGYQSLLDQLDRLPEIAPLRATQRLTLPSDEAVRLATWCARRTG